jgi:hypothetical protein
MDLLFFFVIMIVLPHPMPTYFAFTVFAETIRPILEIDEYGTLRPQKGPNMHKGLIEGPIV